MCDEGNAVKQPVTKNRCREIEGMPLGDNVTLRHFWYFFTWPRGLRDRCARALRQIAVYLKNRRSRPAPWLLTRSALTKACRAGPILFFSTK